MAEAGVFIDTTTVPVVSSVVANVGDSEVPSRSDDVSVDGVDPELVLSVGVSVENRH